MARKSDHHRADMKNECHKCLELTKYFHDMTNHTRKGNAICEECMTSHGIVPLDLPYDPKTGYSELGAVGGFRYLKSDGTIGHLKDGETREIIL